jgi:hypothetical protein
MGYNSQTMPNHPTNVGTKHNLPEHVRAMAGLRNEVIAWTTLDPEHEGDIERYACCRTFGPLLVCPCFWPHMIILSPCLCAACISLSNGSKSQYWILTENELKIVSTSHDQCCLPGCLTSGDIVKSIPLENITDCGVQSKANACGNQCAGDLPKMYVDTASSQEGRHEAAAVALAGHEWFIREILNRRDIVKQGGGWGASAVPPMHSNTVAPAPAVMATAVEMMERGDTTRRSAAERIKEITQLHESGILTNKQYEKKKQEIIDSI